MREILMNLNYISNVHEHSILGYFRQVPLIVYGDIGYLITHLF